MTLIWIPSHTGIIENETANNLATRVCLHPSGNKIRNTLSAAEQIGIFRSQWMAEWIHCLQVCKKTTVEIREHMRRINWHFSPDRRVNISLHRLRSGHTYLNAFLHRIDQNADPSCRRGCEALENVQHVLLDCRSLDEHRRKIVSFFSSNYKKCLYNFKSIKMVLSVPFFLQDFLKFLNFPLLLDFSTF